MEHRSEAESSQSGWLDPNVRADPHREFGDADNVVSGGLVLELECCDERVDLRGEPELECDPWIASLDDLFRNTPIDLAIVNAGTTNASGADGESWPDIDRVLDINLRAALATISALLPHMRRRGSGQIALISSLSAYVGLPVRPPIARARRR